MWRQAGSTADGLGRKAQQLIGFMNANQEWNNTNPVTASYGFYGFRADGDS